MHIEDGPVLSVWNNDFDHRHTQFGTSQINGDHLIQPFGLQLSEDEFNIAVDCRVLKSLNIRERTKRTTAKNCIRIKSHLFLHDMRKIFPASLDTAHAT